MQENCSTEWEEERAKLFNLAGFSSLSVSWGKTWDDYHLLPIGGAIRVT